MEDVFKELKVLVEKGKVALHKLTKMYLKVDTTCMYKQIYSTINYF